MMSYDVTLKGKKDWLLKRWKEREGRERFKFFIHAGKSLRKVGDVGSKGKEVSLNMQMKSGMDAGSAASPPALPTFFIICPISVGLLIPMLLMLLLPAAPLFLPFLVFLASGLFGFFLILYKMRRQFWNGLQDNYERTRILLHLDYKKLRKILKQHNFTVFIE